MNSLVGYGVSSESEDEEKGDDNSKKSFKKTECTVEKTKSRNFLLESESPSSESESAPESEDQEEPPTADSSISEHLPPLSVRPHTHKLPPPPLGGSSSGGALTGSSVFANPFKELAEERLNVLQKHVPLTLQARPTQIDGKRICVAYRKDGRCRFGSRCKFAHDSDLQSNRTVTSDNAPKDNTADNHVPPASCEEDTETNGEKDNEQRKKRRVGVNDSLIPPKRALKQYARLSHP
ncbi:hypothetical protein ROHU_012927 [Labeo rohita]|uniref:Zinc finger CCCH domain-containing protein 37 n=2 Tax=Labeo rohita TaxID=84645 RepID=A0ABQ8N2J6_LABRO|nr:uncharacterized protein si:ch211-113e8.11 [Labeo rohita]KAI2668338.1 Zinc finger CCCH domain-containing protein 37 [Labeo rohita]RXN04436.1 hypothetical protein ROHU_012927 [Labeo rohita]